MSDEYHLRKILGYASAYGNLSPTQKDNLSLVECVRTANKVLWVLESEKYGLDIDQIAHRTKTSTHTMQLYLRCLRYYEYVDCIERERDKRQQGRTKYLWYIR